MISIDKDTGYFEKKKKTPTNKNPHPSWTKTAVEFSHLKFQGP